MEKKKVQNLAKESLKDSPESLVNQEKAVAESQLEQKEAIEKQRREIREAYESALEILQRFLRTNADVLSDLEKAQINQAIKSAENAKTASWDQAQDDYLVKVLNPDGSVAVNEQGNPVQRSEGIPVEGLLRMLEKVQQKQREMADNARLLDKKLSQIDDILEYLNAQTFLGKPGEESLETFFDQSTPAIKEDILKLVGEWQATDRDTGSVNHDQIDPSTGEYNRQFYISQVTEAVNQLKARYQQAVQDRSKKVMFHDTLIDHIVPVLKNNSKNYFKSHYGKSKGEKLSDQESDEQNPYTEREAILIAGDPELKQVLLERYKQEIPDFDQLSEPEQNYQLAMMALRDRELLELPQFTEASVIPGSSKDVIARSTESPAFVESKAIESPKEVELKLDRLLLIDIDEIANSMAWRKAEQQLQEYYASSGRVKRMFRSLSEAGYRFKFYQEALKEIKSNNDLMDAIRGRLSGEARDKNNPQLKDYFELLDSIIDAYEENLVKSTETKESLEQTAEISEAIARMVSAHACSDLSEWYKLGSEYADSSLDPRQRVELYVKNVIVPLTRGKADPAKSENKSGIWSSISGKEKQSEDNQEAVLYASNFWKLAENYKQKQEAEIAKYLQGEKTELSPEEKERVEAALAKHMDGIRNLDIQLGKKEGDLYNTKPKGNLAWYEKAMDWSERSRIGGFLVNPLTVGIAGALASRGVQGALRMGAVAGATIATGGVGGAALALIVGGASGGLYRAFRSNKDLKYDIARERRDETLGGRKSELLEKGLRYVQYGYNEAIDILTEFEGADWAEIPEEMKSEIVKIAAMRSFEQEEGNQVDLFYADSEVGAKTGSVIGLRNQLDLKLRQFASKLPQDQVGDAKASLSTSLAEKDSAEKSFRIKKAAANGVVAGVIGIAAGATMQEVVYVAGRNLGYIDASRSTVLEGLMDKATGKPGQLLNNFLGRANNLIAEGDPGVFRGPDGSSLTAEQVAELKSQGAVFFKGLDGQFHDEAGKVVSLEEMASSAKKPMILEELARKDWHGIGRNFSGKELQQWHVMDKNTGNVKVDVWNMMKSIDKNIIGDNAVNWDKTTDPKMFELLSEMRALKGSGQLHEHIQVRIFPTQEAYNAGQGISAGSINESGTLEFSGDLRNAAFDSSGKQLARAIEVGFTDSKGDFHVFNTAVGKGDMMLPDVGENIFTLEELQPAQYDWMAALVPPGRKIYGKVAEEKNERESKTSGAKTREGAAARKAGPAKRGDLSDIQQYDGAQELSTEASAETSEISPKEMLSQEINQLVIQNKLNVKFDISKIEITADNQEQTLAFFRSAIAYIGVTKMYNIDVQININFTEEKQSALVLNNSVYELRLSTTQGLKKEVIKELMDQVVERKRLEMMDNFEKSYGLKINIPDQDFFDRMPAIDKYLAIKRLNEAISQMSGTERTRLLSGLKLLNITDYEFVDENEVNIPLFIVQNGRVEYNALAVQDIQALFESSYEDRMIPPSPESRAQYSNTFYAQEFLKLPEDVRRSSENKVYYILDKEFSGKLPDNIEVVFSNKYQVRSGVLKDGQLTRPGVVYLDMSKNDRAVLSKQLHVGLRRADPDRINRVRESLDKRAARRK